MNKLKLTGCLLLVQFGAWSQPLMETGPQKKMPDEWIDQDTHHKVVRLSRKEGAYSSFYFHNNPFSGNKMVFYSVGREGKQIYSVDLTTLEMSQVSQVVHPLTADGYPNSLDGPFGEIVGGDSVYYQVKDSVFATNIHTRATRKIFVFPAELKGNITTLNADGSLLAGVQSSDEEKELLKQHPEKSDYFDRIYDAHLPHTLFTINTRTGDLKKIYTENTWLGHVQFSPTDPSLLMFCHEGPWQKVDRIWTIDLRTGKLMMRHKRTVENEIAGHEFFAPDGKSIWFDWQIPKGQTFYLGNVDLATGKGKKYEMTRDEWSIHFAVSKDQRLFAGDGADERQVAKAKNGRWIYLFHPVGDHLVSEKLVNMKDQYYSLEPNVHFSPDQKWIIFRANFEGTAEVYAVELKKS